MLLEEEGMVASEQGIHTFFENLQANRLVLSKLLITF